MGLRTLPAAAAFAMATIVTPALPQDGGVAPPVPPTPLPSLRVRVESGREIAFTLRWHVESGDGSAEGGAPPFHEIYDLATPVSVRALDPPPGASVRLHLTFGRTQGAFSGQCYDRGAVVDTDLPAPTSYRVILAWAVPGALAGASFDADLDGSGNVVSLSGVDEAVRSGLRRAGRDANVAALELTPAAVAKWIRALLAPLPHAATSRRSWTASETWFDGLPLEWRCERTDTASGVARITATGQLAPGTANPSFQLLEATRTAEVSLEDGLPVHSRMLLATSVRYVTRDTASRAIGGGWLPERTIVEVERGARAAAPPPPPAVASSDLPPGPYAAPPVVRPPAGWSAGFEFAIEGERERTTASGTARSAWRIVYELGLTCSARLPDGRSRIRFAVTRVSGRVEAADGGPAEFDSAASAPVPEGRAAGVTGLLAWAGRNVELLVSADGTVREIRGLAEARAAAAKQWAAGGPEPPAIGRAFRESDVQDLVGWFLVGSPYRGVRGDGTWTTEPAVPAFPGEPRLRVRWRLAALTGATAHDLSLDGRGAAAPEAGDPWGAGAEVTAARASVHATFGDDDGLPVAAESEVRCSVHVAAGDRAGTGTVVVRTTLRRRVAGAGDGGK